MIKSKANPMCSKVSVISRNSLGQISDQKCTGIIEVSWLHFIIKSVIVLHTTRRPRDVVCTFNEGCLLPSSKFLSADRKVGRKIIELLFLIELSKTINK